MVLDRVCNNIKFFPKHDVAFLTACVGEVSTGLTKAQKVGLKGMAFKWSKVLCSPEFRDRINANYKKKIEDTARRHATDERAEEVSACPFCAKEFPSFGLSCPHCTMSVPFCIATGKYYSLKKGT
jgi:hypothetical protein